MTRLPLTVRSCKTLFALAALVPSALLVGCGLKDDADSFRGGVPRHETVEVRVPGGAQPGSLTAEGGAVQSALLGQKAEYYVLTRAVTAVINGGTFAVLTLVKTIVGYPATSVNGDTAVWGPHTEPLSPNTWRLTVTRLEPHKFQYALDAKPKTADDSAFLTILAGTHTRAVGPGGPIEGFGNGTFTDRLGRRADAARARQERRQGGLHLRAPQLQRHRDHRRRLHRHQGRQDRRDLQRRLQVRRDAGRRWRLPVRREPGLPARARQHRHRQGEADHPQPLAADRRRPLRRADLGRRPRPPPAPPARPTTAGTRNFASVFKHSSCDPAQAGGAGATCAFTPAEYSTL